MGTSIVLIAAWALGVFSPTEAPNAAVQARAGVPAPAASGPGTQQTPANGTPAVARGYDVSAVMAGAAAVLDLVKSTRQDTTVGGPGAYPFFETNLNNLERSATAVVNGADLAPAAAAAKNNVLFNDLANTANSAIDIGSRPRMTSQSRAKFEQIAVTLRTISDRLMGIVLPVAAASTPAPETAAAPLPPAKKVAADTIELVHITMRDTSYVGPRMHTFLVTELRVLERAAQSVADDGGRDPAALVAKTYALGSALQETADYAAGISRRPDETTQARDKSDQMASALRALILRLARVFPATAVRAPPTAGVRIISSPNAKSTVQGSIVVKIDGRWVDVVSSPKIVGVGSEM
jgi:hypothetical protein